MRAPPLRVGKNVVHQLEIITDLLGTPHHDVINKVRNEKARRFLGNMRVKPHIPFQTRFPNADPRGLALLERMLAYDPEDRPTAEEALADPYFAGLADPTREPHAEIVSRTEYAFESRKLTPEEVRGLLYREILETTRRPRGSSRRARPALTFSTPTAAWVPTSPRRKSGSRTEAWRTGTGISFGGARSRFRRRAWTSTGTTPRIS